MNLKRCLSMILSFFSASRRRIYVSAVYAAATLGTESNPYQITTAKQLQDIKYDLSGCMFVRQIFDLAQVDFAPIGGDAETGSFSGVFDGNGHTISNLNVFAGKYAGLFGCNEGVIKNVVLKDVNVYGSRYVGGVVAENTSYGTVSACTVQSGNVRSDGSVSEINIGGICGIKQWLFSKRVYERCCCDGAIELHKHLHRRHNWTEPTERELHDKRYKHRQHLFLCSEA